MKTFSFAKASCLLFGICSALATQAPAQTFTVLQNFESSDPTSALVQGLDGNFYGTMEGGDIGFEGNVYTLTPSGAYTSIATPCCYSFAPLVLASNGYFYGFTISKAESRRQHLQDDCLGRRTPPSTAFARPPATTAHTPAARWFNSATAIIYGTTVSTIFKITLAGVLTTLYNFCPGTTLQRAVSSHPFRSALASDGNFYGSDKYTAETDGTVFKMTPSAP